MFLLSCTRSYKQIELKRAEAREGGASEKRVVFGMPKCDGKVYAQIVKNCSENELITILSAFS